MSEGESPQSKEQEIIKTEVAGYKSLLARVYGVEREDVGVDEGNLAEVKAEFRKIAAHALPVIQPLIPKGKTLFQHQRILRQRGLHPPSRFPSSFNELDVRITQKYFGLEGVKKDLRQIAEDEELNAGSIKNRLNKAIQFFRSPVAHSLRKFVNLPPTEGSPFFPQPL